MPPEPPMPATLPVLVICPKAPAWLVAKYVVNASYVLGGVYHSAGQQTIGHEGGTFEGKVTADNSENFPDKVKVQFVVEYEAETGLPAFSPPPVEVKRIPEAAYEVLTIQLPQRRLAYVELNFELPHGAFQKDYLHVRLAYFLTGRSVTARQTLLKYEDLLPGNPHPAKPVTKGFVLDPTATGTEKLRIEIKGRYLEKELPAFQTEVDFDLPEMVLLARIKDDPSGDGFHVELL